MRLFLAIPLPDSVQKAVGNIINVLREVRSARGTFPKPTNLHLTVQFLGDVPESLLDRLKTSVGEAVATTPAIEPLILEQVGTFPNLRNPKVIWVGGLASDPLKAFAATIKRACTEAGAPPDDKGFNPHVTVMRIKELYDPKSLQTFLMRVNYSPQTVPVQQLILFKSELAETGPIYTVLKSWKIG